jgi:hypothetical protein
MKLYLARARSKIAKQNLTRARKQTKLEQAKTSATTGAEGGGRTLAPRAAQTSSDVDRPEFII